MQRAACLTTDPLPPPRAQAVQLAEIEVDYQRMKARMKAKMAELQNQLAVTGQAPTLASALGADPLFSAAVHAAPVPGPALSPGASSWPQLAPALQQQGYAPPQQMMGMPPPGIAGGYPAAAFPQESAAKRDQPDFHHVPPPKRADMRCENLLRLGYRLTISHLLFHAL